MESENKNNCIGQDEEPNILIGREWNLNNLVGPEWNPNNFIGRDKKVTLGEKFHTQHAQIFCHLHDINFWATTKATEKISSHGMNFYECFWLLLIDVFVIKNRLRPAGNEMRSHVHGRRKRKRYIRELKKKFLGRKVKKKFQGQIYRGKVTYRYVDVL